MKYIIFFTLLFTPILGYSIEFLISPKEYAQVSQAFLKEKGWKIKDIIPLDNDAEGYVKIIYE